MFDRFKLKQFSNFFLILFQNLLSQCLDMEFATRIQVWYARRGFHAGKQHLAVWQQLCKDKTSFPVHEHAKNTFYSIQDAYCINAVKEFWKIKRAQHHQSKDEVVVLGKS